jgi:hypothetical protein
MAVKPQNLLVIMSDEHNPRPASPAAGRCGRVSSASPACRLRYVWRIRHFLTVVPRFSCASSFASREMNTGRPASGKVHRRPRPALEDIPLRQRRESPLGTETLTPSHALGVLFNAGLPRGTGSSNPPPSSGESGANLIFRGRIPSMTELDALAPPFGGLGRLYARINPISQSPLPSIQIAALHELARAR